MEESLPKLNSGEVCRKEKHSPLQTPSCQLCSLLISLMGNLSPTVCGKMLTSHCCPTSGSEELTAAHVHEKRAALLRTSRPPGVCS